MKDKIVISELILPFLEATGPLELMSDQVLFLKRTSHFFHLCRTSALSLALLWKAAVCGTYN